MKPRASATGVRVKKSGSKKATTPRKYFDIKTFTWYISAPKGHGAGHREKEFDKVMHGILQSGHEVIEWKLQSVGGERGGMYAVFLLGSLNKKVTGPLLDLHEQFTLNNTPTNPDIELEAL